MTRRAVVIQGLRRSGTTALWASFRGQEGVAAFDEPFNPELAQGIRSNFKQTWDELGVCLDREGLTPVAIGPEEELAGCASPQERAYLGQLMEAAPRVAIDLVRVWNRGPGLFEEPDRVLSVLLVRDPISWVTGHLMPSGRGTWRKSLANPYRRASFFSRRGFFNNYFYETITDAALQQRHPLWSAAQVPIEALTHAPAYMKLLAFWWGANLTAYRALRDAGAPAMVVTLGEFCAKPQQVVRGVLEQAGWTDLDLATGHVVQTRSGHRPTDDRWLRAADALGIPAVFFEPGGATAEALEAAFDVASPAVLWEAVG